MSNDNKDNQLRSDRARDIYDAWHRAHQADLDVDARSPWYEMIKSRLRPELDLSGKRILEIGCGLGSFAIWLRNQNVEPMQIIAADFSLGAIETASRYAQTNGISEIEWTVKDIQNTNFGDGEFDTVFSCETIEHVPDPFAAVVELARVLKPGGRLYLTTPNYLSTIGVYRVYCRLRGKTFDEGGQPICNVTMIYKTRRWMKQAGFRIIATHSCGQYLPFPGRQPLKLNWAEYPTFLMKYFGHHSMLIGEKL